MTDLCISWRHILGHIGHHGAIKRDDKADVVACNYRLLSTNISINFKLATLTHNTLNSSQPAYLRSLLSYHTPARSLRSSNTNLLSVPRVHTTYTTCGFSVAAPSYGTHSMLTFVLVLHHILSVVFLKPTVLIRPSVPPSRSHKCLRFGLWSTLCTAL